MIEFPENFYWGAATSAYQVEGNNTNSDWWEWEKRTGLKETSGWACRHYELYGLDFDLAQQLNHNCHRLSIEWSRIEPKAGEFSREELNHYRDVILSLKERNLEPIVTLHHFTNPLWFAEAGGWENKQAQNYFCRYLEKVLEALSDKVTYWITINEPMVYIYHGFVLGLWPPQKKSFLKAKRVMRHLARTHTQAYRLIHNFYQQRNLINPQVSVAAHLQAFVPCALTLKNKIAVYLRDRFFNFAFLDRLLADKTLDFIGVNYYTRSLVDVERWGLKNLVSASCNKNHRLLPKNSLGWDIYPGGLYTLLLRLKKYRLPIFILENGICTADDDLRWNFIRAHLKNMHLAMAQGINVLGYIYWSLIDNFEWDKGFAHRFGLIEVDYQNYARRVRESARKFALVCRTGKLNENGNNR